MMGLAYMAMRLAQRRTGGILFRGDGTADPVPRDRLDVYGPWPASIEYYRIIDRLTKGEKP